MSANAALFSIIFLAVGVALGYWLSEARWRDLGKPDANADRTYVITLYRTAEEDDPAVHGGRDGAEQVAAELQEAMEVSGVPVGHFEVSGPWSQ